MALLLICLKESCSTAGDLNSGFRGWGQPSDIANLVPLKPIRNSGVGHPAHQNMGTNCGLKKTLQTVTKFMLGNSGR